MDTNIETQPVRKPVPVSRFVRVAQRAYEVARATLPTYSHAKSPHRFTLPQRAACVLMSFYLKMSYRDTEELLLASSEIREALELKNVPDYSTLSRTYKRLRKSDWDSMLERILSTANDGQGVQEEHVAIDSTYYAATQASLSFLTRAGRTLRTPYKGAYAVGVESRLIVAVRTGVGTGSDAKDLGPLRRAARHYGVLTATGKRQQVVLADRGYDGKAVIATDLVPPIRRNGKIKNPKRRAKADQVSQARLDGLYGQRWKAETVNSVIKRKFGSSVRSRLRRLQEREALVRALVYNLHVLMCLFRALFAGPQFAS